MTCRTLLNEGESCSGKRHQTADLGTTPGRSKIDDEVWGPDSRARKIRQATRAGAGGATIGGIFEGCDLGGGVSSCDVSGEAILGAIAVVIAMAVLAVVAVVLWWIIKAIASVVRNAMDRPKPHGALLEPPKVKRVVAGRGVVKSGTPVMTPWKAGSTFAYAMELYEDRVFGGGAMLRDAWAAGFDVTLDDGRTLRIPEGRVRILGKREKVSTDTSRVDAFLREIDTERTDGDRSIFPYDHARAVTIDPGDHVEVLGDVDITSGEGSSGYRSNAGMLVPIGVPVLRVHKATTAAEPATRVRVDGGAAAEEPDEEEAGEADAGRAAGR